MSPITEAVEQRHAPAASSARQDASRWQEAEIIQGRGESLLPVFAIGLGFGEGAGDAPPAVLHRAIDRRAVECFQPILRIPDLPGNLRDAVRDPGLRELHVHSALLFL
jgi:hypothetical protein